MTIAAVSDAERDAGLRVLTALGNHGLAVPDSAGPGSTPVEVRFRRNVGRPLPGDRIRVDAHGGLTAIEPRTALFGRGARHGRFQPIAANLTTLIIVIAPEPAPSRDLIHRYVAAARLEGINPLIVVNKSDLGVPDAAPFDELHDLAVPVVHTRTTEPANLDGLAGWLTSGLHLLAGQSGVGKSSLANALLPDLDLQTERLSRATGKGRHTTTSARLFRLPDRGWLVDTPGVWEYGLWAMPVDQLQRAFPEFARLPACRFRDCRHLEEPGCAVRAAAETGALPDSRYQAWRSLLREQQRIS